MNPTELEVEVAFEELPPTEAMRVLLPLAEKGHAVAQFYVGELYGLGDAVPRDDTLALEWYLRSAASGYPRAHHYVAVCYEQGLGCRVDLALAGKYFESAAQLGFRLSPPDVNEI